MKYLAEKYPEQFAEFILFWHSDHDDDWAKEQYEYDTDEGQNPEAKLEDYRCPIYLMHQEYGIKNVPLEILVGEFESTDGDWEAFDEFLVSREHKEDYEK